jgi:RNA polymerase sigma-70 factor (ECF subfamily)
MPGSNPFPLIYNLARYAVETSLTRLSSLSPVELIDACAESNESEAWVEFVVRFRRPIGLSVLRIAYQWGGVPRQVVDDLIQDTYLKLCADRCQLLRDFAARNPEAVLGYIKTMAVNVAHDHFKSLHSQKRGFGETSQLSNEVEPQARLGSQGSSDSMERELLLKEIDRHLGECSEGPDQERDRLIFWLYYQQGMSAKSIAALPTVGLTAKGVESAIFRLTHLIREQITSLRSPKSIAPQAGEKGLRSAESY